jgi:hypothetical protein
VLDRLAASPAIVTVDSQRVLVSREDVQTVIALQSGEQAFVRRLPQLIGEMDAGEFTSMARLVRDVVKNRPLGTVMTYMTDLASGASDARMRKIREEIPSAVLGDAINYPFDDPDFQAVWNAPDLGPSFRAPIQSKVPTLFISGTLDGRTSLADADEVRRGFSASSHFIVAGASHNIYAVTPALRDAMLRFVRGESVKDTVVVAPHLELLGPDGNSLATHIRQVLTSAGANAAADTLRAAAKNGSGHHVTSLFVNNLVTALARSDAQAATAILNVGLELFPWSSPLLTRKAQAAAAAGDRTSAIAAYRAAIDEDPFNQVAVVELRKLQ